MSQSNLNSIVRQLPHSCPIMSSKPIKSPVLYVRISAPEFDSYAPPDPLDDDVIHPREYSKEEGGIWPKLLCC